MPEKVVDKETKRLRKGLEEKVIKRKEGKLEVLENLTLKKADVKKQKYKKNVSMELQDSYEEWEDFYL